MSRTRQRYKGRTESGTYLAIPHAVMRSENWRAMPNRAVRLVCDIGAQYNGSNNGDLSAAWRIMQPKGWRSRDTLGMAVADALRFGMIEKTRQGGLHVCSLYALTWHAIDECGGKLDVAATRVPSGLWKQPPQPAKQKNANTESVSIKHGIRVNSIRKAAA